MSNCLNSYRTPLPNRHLKSHCRQAVWWLLLSTMLAIVGVPYGAGETVGSAPSVNLGGKWDFRFDASDAGEAGGWYKPEAMGAWQSIQVPGSYNDQFEGKRDYAGKAWYRTRFAVSAGPGEHAVLKLGAVDLRARVWVNGQLAGSTILPFTPVDFDITSFLQHGGHDNVLVLETDNTVLTKSVLDSNWKGWQNDGGLIWPVTVTVQPALYSTTHLTTTMDPDGGWDTVFDVTVHNHSAAKAVSVSAAIMDGAQTVWSETDQLELTGEDTPLHLTAAVQGVHAWSPDSPHLYRYVLRIGAPDKPREEISFGFRQIEVHGSRLTLNSKPLLLRGINRHSFYPGVGMSVPVAQTEKDFADIKALHANFVRLAHYPQPEEVYELCDRLGLLVWTEIPVWQTLAPNLTDPAIFSDYIRPMLEASVTRHWNHPSVIVWSVANEIQSDKPAVADVMKKEIEYVKTLDSSRLVTFASNQQDKDLGFAAVDFIAINEYFGWYYGKQNDLGGLLDRLHASYPNKPIFVSEYGVESVAGWVPPKVVLPNALDYSLEHQARFLQSHLEQIYAPSRQSFMMGGAPWLYNDFPVPYKSNTSDHPDNLAFINAKGLVTQQREHKPAYFTVQKFYEQLAQGNRPSPVDVHEPALAVVEQYPSPVITVKSPGAEGNKYGFEGGNVVKSQGTYHLVTTELTGEPFAVKTKFAHWSSEDRVHWKRVSTLFESSGEFEGKDPRAALWGPMFVYDQLAGAWSLFYVAYRAQPDTPTQYRLNYEGAIWRAVSKVKGPAGIDGPYSDVGVILRPDKDSQKWEGEQGTDSFFPFEAGNHWLGFYGSSNAEHPTEHWRVGLAEATQLAGPWTRRADTNPVDLDKRFTENPIVTRLDDGSYIAVYDNEHPNAIGYAWSSDGLHWTAGKDLVVQPKGKGFWADHVRTPLGLIEEGHGRFTLFYTGFIREPGAKDMGPGAIGFVSLKLQSQN